MNDVHYTRMIVHLLLHVTIHIVWQSTPFQTHFVQLTKPSQVFVGPTGIQALPSPCMQLIPP